MSLESRKTIFEIGGVVLLFLTFVFGAGALFTTYKVNKEQAARLRQFDADLTLAKTDLGKQQVLAANAAAEVAGLERASADAKAEMARQQTKAAEAERQLLELQEKVRARHITKEQADAIKGTLQNLSPHEVNISVVMGTWDGTTLGLELAAAINSAGWTARVIGQEASGGELRGMALVMKDVAHPIPGTLELQNALKAASISAPIWRHPAWGGTNISLLIAPRG